MSLREEIIPYVDGNGLVAPNVVPEGTMQGSDNGPMFTAEYYIMLNYRQEEAPAFRDSAAFVELIQKCCSPPGNLMRAPGSVEQEQVDDFYGVLAACRVLSLYDWLPWNLAQDMLDHGWKNWGSYNSLFTNKWTKESFMWRQPQLLAAMYAAADRQSWRTWPLFAYAALVIAISCIGVPVGRTDERRLAWLLIQAVAPVSRMCRLASRLWYRRLYRDYPDGMRGVAAIYYQGDHPFKKYWVDESPLI